MSADFDGGASRQCLHFLAECSKSGKCCPELRDGLLQKKFCGFNFVHNVKVPTGGGIDIQRFVLAEIIAILSASLLVLYCESFLRNPTNILTVPESRDKTLPLLVAISAGRTAKKAVCVRKISISFAPLFSLPPGRTGGLFPHLKTPRRAEKYKNVPSGSSSPRNTVILALGSNCL